MLIAARALQGVGAALMTPQTMSMITRVFPPQKRGAAMGLWGAVAGIATITGPVLGGLLVQTVGWEWIFYVNIPVGVVALVLALRTLPTLPTANRSFDGLGVLLSVVGMFLVVFGLQEGATYDWGTITGPITVWGVIGAGRARARRLRALAAPPRQRRAAAADACSTAATSRCPTWPAVP